MKSPFPGMDPYLEQHWRDVHAKLITYIADTIQPLLPNDLVARTEECLYVSSEHAARGYREIYPDVRVLEIDTLPVQPVPSKETTAIAEPLIIELTGEPMTETFVQIQELNTDRVITVIEVLSVTNKTSGDGAKAYKQKQLELEASGIGLVEIDLLRNGQWVLRVPRNRLGPQWQTPYRVCVSPGWELNRVRYYPIGLRERLRPFQVPLREHDEQITLEMQPLIDQVYRNGRYGSINYRDDADPALTGEDREWADELLRAAGKR